MYPVAMLSKRRKRRLPDRPRVAVFEGVRVQVEFEAEVTLLHLSNDAGTVLVE